MTLSTAIAKWPDNSIVKLTQYQPGKRYGKTRGCCFMDGSDIKVHVYWPHLGTSSIISIGEIKPVHCGLTI